MSKEVDKVEPAEKEIGRRLEKNIPEEHGRLCVLEA